MQEVFCKLRYADTVCMLKQLTVFRETAPKCSRKQQFWIIHKILRKKLSLFFNKAAGERSEILSKSDSDLGVCLWILQSFNRRLTEGLNTQVLVLCGQETAFDMFANL